MTQLVDPTALHDPTALVDPTALHDPTALDASPQSEQHTVKRRDHRLELAAAVVAALLLARHHLAKSNPPSPGQAEDQARHAWAQASPLWLAAAVPILVHLYEQHLVGEGLSEAERRTLATNYAESMGAYIGASSAAAVSEGFDRQLAGQWHPSVAWTRAVSGYGLDSRQMRGYVDGLAATKDAKQLVPEQAQQMVGRAVSDRADDIAGNETHSAVQNGHAAGWAFLVRTGRLPQGTRKEWDIHAQLSTCALCRELDGQQVGVDEPFELHDGVKLWAPQAHPNCECRMKLVHPDDLSKADEQADKQVAGICLLAADTGRVLMIQRENDPKDPCAGKWEFAGGHIEPGETLLAGARREWQEEVHQRLPSDVRLISQWNRGIYTGFVLRTAHEASVQPHKRGRVVNPDDPKRHAVEAIAWWDPAHLARNPAVRPELRASAGLVRYALRTKLAKAYDPDERREPKGSEHGGRWVRVAEREAQRPEVTPVGTTEQPSRFQGSRFQSARFQPARFQAEPQFQAEPRFQAAAESDARFSAGSRFDQGGKLRRSVHRRALVLLPSAPTIEDGTPTVDAHYMDANDLLSSIGYEYRRNGETHDVDQVLLHQVVDFDDAQTRQHEDLIARRAPNAWWLTTGITDDLESATETEARHRADAAWNDVLKAAHSARSYAYDDVEGQVGHLESPDLYNIASVAGLTINSSDDDVRQRIIDSVDHGTGPGAESLAAAYGDYMAFVKHQSLGQDGDEVDKAIDTFTEYQPGYDAAQVFQSPMQVLVFSDKVNSYEDEVNDQAGYIKPRGEYYVAGMVYQSKLDHGVSLPAGMLGVQEALMRPMDNE